MKRDRSGLRSLAMNACLLIVSLLVCFLICEFVFRILYPSNTSDMTRSFEFSHSRKLNSDGFRDEDFAAKMARGGIRVLFLGDSFTEGMGVEVPYSFAGLLSRELGTKGFQTFNLGRLGTGTIDHRKILEEYISRIHPKFVFLFFYWNDVQDCLEETDRAQTAQTVQAAPAKTHPFLPVPSNVKKILTKSTFYRWAAYKWRVLMGRLGVAKLDSNTELDYFDKLGRNPQVARGWGLVESEISRMKKVSADQSAQLVVIDVPKREQFTGFDGILKFYHANSAEYERFLPNQKLSEICTRQGVPFIDISEEMSRLPEPASLYYRFDTHFTAKGNREYYALLKPRIDLLLKKISFPTTAK